MASGPLSHLAKALLVCALCLPASPALAAWSHDSTTTGVEITPNPLSDSIQQGTALADGAGGFFVPGIRVNGSNNDVWVQHIGRNGTPASGWPAAGVVVATGTGLRTDARIVLSNAGTVLVFWRDRRSGSRYEIYGQRVNAAGVPQWNANGVRVNPAFTNEFSNLSVCSDGTAGAFVSCTIEFSATEHDIWMSHVSNSGTFAAFEITGITGIQTASLVTSDGVGGAFIAYEDRAPSPTRVRLAHVNSTNAINYDNAVNGNSATTNKGLQILLADGVTGCHLGWTETTPAVSVSLVLSHYALSGAEDVGPFGSRFSFTATGGSIPWSSLTLAPDLSVFLAFDAIDNLGVSTVRTAHRSTSYQAVLGSPVVGSPITVYGPQTAGNTVPDGFGGVLQLVDDNRSGSSRLGMVDLTSSTVFGPLSSLGGHVIVARATNNHSLVADPDGGAFVLWNDVRSGVSRSYVAHVDRYGIPGDASPTTAGVWDVPGNQGGSVDVRWNKSWMDGDPKWGIGTYWIWRQAPITLANAAVHAGAGAWADGADASALERSTSEGAIATRYFRHDAASASPYAWEYLGAMLANGSASYSYFAGTTTDSIGGHNPYTIFMVEAHSAVDSRAFWQMAPDSGYSVDNLPPAAPSPFTGQYGAGVAHLHWSRNTEPDFAGYRLYRGATPGFTPNAASLLSAQPDTGYVDATGTPHYYKLSAVDRTGNESPFTFLQPSGTVDAGDPAPHALAFALASGNPARGSATLRFALPNASHVRLTLYDTAGREVRVLTDARYEAGAFTHTWDGTDANGSAAPSGLYFARLATEARVMTTRLVLSR